MAKKMDDKLSYLYNNDDYSDDSNSNNKKE